MLRSKLPFFVAGLVLGALAVSTVLHTHTTLAGGMISESIAAQAPTAGPVVRTVIARAGSFQDAVDIRGVAAPTALVAVNPGGQLWPGQSVALHVPLAAPTAVVCVPQEAVFRSGESDAVYVIGKASIAELRPVVNPIGTGKCARVGGLVAGEEVVIWGQDGIAPGVRVSAVLEK